ncbi:MAG: DciA family protein [Patescibacteria group bacterium]
MSFTSLGKLIPQNIKQSGFGRQIEAAMVLKELEQILCSIFGDSVKYKIKIISFKDSAVKISSISSILAQEIQLREKKILARINQKFGEKTVERIKFAV